ncbi:hypothetical protein DJ81_03615 [Halorubrum sp. Hd13]|nr:hypothetical protein DJ81_03615 [Halorubrum sp. Hd13]
MWRKLFLTVGFVAVAAGTAFAWQTPATAYEVSIYAATPLPFWIGVSIGFLSAAVVTLRSCRDRVAGLAVALGLVTTVAIGALPVVRSYRFYGRADPMTHLGWATEMLAGRMEFGEVFYPGGHSTTALLTDAMGVPIERGMLLVAALYFAMYALFIPLIAKALSGNREMTVIAAFSGFMILPINQISNGLFFHTYSMAMWFFPVFLYALVKHIKSEREVDSITDLLLSDLAEGSVLDTVGAWNVLLAVLGVTLILIHPQVALNVIILLGTLVVLHAVVCKRLDLFVSDLRPVYGAFVFILVCWLVWIFQFDQVFSVGERVIISTYEAILGTADAGESVEARYQSARSVEATLPELFVKLFLVPTVYIALGFSVVAYTLWHSFGDTDRRNISTDVDPLSRSVVTYFGYAGLVLGPFFIAHFMGPISHLFFRHYGFGMMFAIVLGAVAVHRIGVTIPSGWLKIAKPLALGLLTVALALSLLTVFTSPYIYNATHHVSDRHVNGYETAIEHRGEEIQWSGIRNGPGREFDALLPGTGRNSRLEVSEGSSTYNDAELQALLSGRRDAARYLPVSEIDVEREVIAYREVRYSRESLRQIGTRPGVHHVQDNGGFDLYYVTPRGGGSAPAETDV